MPENYIFKGVRRIIKFELFESENSIIPEVEEWLNSCTTGSWQFNDRTGTVSVEGDFDCSYQDLEDFKGVKFSSVNGNFFCENNDLTSLEGCPETVSLSFDCSDNLLTSLVGGPKEVGVIYDCSVNKLTSLEGCPENFTGIFKCSNNRLKNLRYCPTAPSSLSCKSNLLETLEGGPENIKSRYDCSNNKISNFSGFPKVVGISLNLSGNKFDEFNKMPLVTGGDLNFSNNQISSIIGLRIPDRGKIMLDGNPLSKNQLDEIKSSEWEMKRLGLAIEDAILLRGCSWTPEKVFYDEKLKGPKPSSGLWEKLQKQTQIKNLERLLGISDNPKQFYDAIQSNPDRLAILASVRNDVPEIWEKIKDFGKAKLSAEAGDLYF